MIQVGISRGIEATNGSPDTGNRGEFKYHPKTQVTGPRRLYSWCEQTPLPNSNFMRFVQVGLQISYDFHIFATFLGTCFLHFFVFLF